MAAERDRSREITAGVDIEAPDSEKPAHALKTCRAVRARSAVVGLPSPLDDDGAMGLLSTQTGHWPSQKSATKLQLSDRVLRRESSSAFRKDRSDAKVRMCAANHPRGRATPAYSGFRKNTTRCVSSNPNAVWSAWLAEFSSRASEPNSTHPSDFPQSATALHSDRAIPFRLSTGRTKIPSRNRTGELLHPFT